MKELTEKEKRLAKYRWEFLRRNSNYINKWEELQKEMEQIYGPHGYPRPPEGELTAEEAAFTLEWGIRKPLDPHNSFDEIVSKHEALEKCHDLLFDPTGSQGKRPVSPVDGWEPKYDGEVFHSFIISDKLSKTGLLEVQIDLKYSKKKLMDELKSLIDEWKKLYERDYKRRLFAQFHNLKETQNPLPTVEEDKDFDVDLNEELIGNMGSKEDFEKFYKQKVKERQKEYRTKYHVDNFNVYLQVWDLKEKENLSWNKIATELFPGYSNGVQTARNHWNAAHDIIKNGIELYVR